MAAWQTVADFIDAEAAKEVQPAPAVAPRRRPSRRAQVPSSEGLSAQSISERI